MVGIIVLIFYVHLIYWNYLATMWKYVHCINLKFQFVCVCNTHCVSLVCHATHSENYSDMTSWNPTYAKHWPRSDKSVTVWKVHPGLWLVESLRSSFWLAEPVSQRPFFDSLSLSHVLQKCKKRVGRNLKFKTTHNRLQGCGLLCNTSCFFKVKQQMKRKHLSSDQIVKIKRIM